MRPPAWMRWLLDMRDDSAPWPPTREYEYRFASGKPHGPRERHLNACRFSLAQHAGERVTSGDPNPAPHRILYLTVVSTGERVEVESVVGGGTRLYGVDGAQVFR